MRHTADLTHCPACGSASTLCVLGTDLDLCLECQKCWERIPKGEVFSVDDEMLSFKRMCDNCAFRKGSEERKDHERWADLQQTLAMGGEFYCHKGVPLKASIEEIAAGAPDSRMGFDFPVVVRRADIEGKCFPYLTYDREHMRMCRGWLSAFVTPLMRR